MGGAPRGDRVRICNGVIHDQVPAFLNAMGHPCVSPSQTTPRLEASSSVGWLIEAFASGVTVVASDSGEDSRVVRDTGPHRRREGRSRLAGEAIADLVESPAKRDEALGPEGWRGQATSLPGPSLPAVTWTSSTPGCREGASIGSPGAAPSRRFPGRPRESSGRALIPGVKAPRKARQASRHGRGR